MYSNSEKRKLDKMNMVLNNLEKKHKGDVEFCEK